MANSTVQKENNDDGGMQNFTSKGFLTTMEAAVYLNVSINTIYKLTAKKEFTIYKPGNKKIYIKKEDLDEWVVSKKRQTYSRIIHKAIDFIPSRNVVLVAHH